MSTFSVVLLPRVIASWSSGPLTAPCQGGSQACESRRVQRWETRRCRLGRRHSCSLFFCLAHVPFNNTVRAATSAGHRDRMSVNLRIRYWGVLHERFHIANECHFYADAFLLVPLHSVTGPYSPDIQSFFLRPSHIRLAFACELSSLFLLLAFNTNCGDLCPVRTSNART